MKHSIKVTLAALLMATSLGATAGHHGGQECGMRGQGEMHKALWQLDLSDEQRTEIKAIFKASKEEHKAKREQRDDEVRKAEREQRKAQMKALMDAAEFDEEAAKALIAERQQKQSERQLVQMRNHHQVMQILTVEQREQLAEMHKERGEKRRKRNQ